MMEDNVIPNEHSKICSKHFTEDSFKGFSKRGKQLKHGAYPTIEATAFVPPSQDIEIQQMDVASSQNHEISNGHYSEDNSTFDERMVIDSKTASTPGVTTSSDSRNVSIPDMLNNLSSSIAPSFGTPTNIATQQRAKKMWDMFVTAAKFFADIDLFCIAKRRADGQFLWEQKIYPSHFTEDISQTPSHPDMSASIGDHPTVENGPTNAVSLGLSHHSDLHTDTEQMDLEVKSNSRDFGCQTIGNINDEQVDQHMVNHAVSPLPVAIATPSRTNVIVTKERNSASSYVSYGELISENNEVRTSADSGIEISPANSERSLNIQNSPYAIANRIPTLLRPQSRSSDFHRTIVSNGPRTPALSPANSSASMKSAGGRSSYSNSVFRHLPPTLDSLIEIEDGSDIFAAYLSFTLKVTPLPTRTTVNGSFNSFSSVSNPSALLQALIYENFYTDPTKWLLDKQLVLRNYLCNPCSQPMQLSSEGNRSPNCQWTCLWCKKKELFIKPTLFSHFPNIPLQDLLAIVYHWAVMSDISDLFHDMKFKIDTALSIWNGLRQFCAAILHEAHPTIGGDNVVEVTVIKFGVFYVVAAMERITKFTRLKAVPIETHIDAHPEIFQHIIASWLKAGTSIVHESSNLNDRSLNTDGECYDLIYYLKTRLQHIFGQYDTNTLKIEFFQACLDELQWRERWGHDGQRAFWNMLHFIFGSRYENVSPLPDDHPFNLPEINQVTTCLLPDNQLYKHPGTSHVIDDLQDSLNSDVPIPLQVREFNISESSIGTGTPPPSETFPSVGIEENSLLSDNATSSSVLAVSVSDVATNFEPPKPELPDNMEEVSKSMSSVNELSVSRIGTPVEISYKPEPVAVEEGTGESDIHDIDLSWNNEEHFVPDITTIQEGNLEASPSELLRIRTWPLLDFPDLTISETRQTNYRLEVQELEAHLKTRELFTCPVEWIYKSDTLLSGTTKTCPDCKGQDFQMVRCLSIDEFFYSCSRIDCHWQERFVRPKIFRNFGLPLRNITTLMFHWAVQSDFDTVTASVSKQVDSPETSLLEDRTMSLCAMSEDGIWNFYETLQNALTPLLTSTHFLLGGSNRIVEANVIKFGIFYILCALQRGEKKKFRFQVFPITAGWDVKTFVKQIEAWLSPETIVISPFEGYDLEKNQITHYPTDPESDNVTTFSKSVLSFLFGNFCSALLSLDRIQGFLSELVWRQDSNSLSHIFFGMLARLIKLYGREEPNDTPMDTPTVNTSAQDSFLTNSNISQSSTSATVPAVDEIRVSSPSVSVNSNLDGVASPSATLTTENESNELFPVPASNISQKKVSASGSCKSIKSRKRSSSATSQNTPPPLASVKSHTSNCFNELEYYARIGNITDSHEHEKIIVKSHFFKCFECHEVLQENFSAMTHIFSHYIAKRMEYLHKESLYICIYCCLEFECLSGLNYHTEQVHSVLENITCLLCSKLFSTENDLKVHFHKHHKKCEMPYSCKMCSFRSSLYVDITDHFVSEHADKENLLCFMCFEQFHSKLDGNGYLGTKDFIDHLMKHHNRVAGQYKCKSCCLVFCTDEERIAHKTRDHVTFSNSADVTAFQNKMPLYRTRSFAGKNQYYGYQPITSQNSNNDSQMIHIHFGASPIKLPTFSGVQKCFECKQPIDKKHFLHDYQCPHCKFKTSCAAKFHDHKQNVHQNFKKRRIVGPMPFKFPKDCRCGSSFSDGDEMASHVLNCRHHNACFADGFTSSSSLSSS